MSPLKVSQIKSKLKSLFESELDLSDISPKDKERELKILSRCLAAFAIYSQSDCSTSEAAASVWDGGGDNGIDAVYHDPSQNIVYVVQAKFIQKGAGEPEARDISAFADGVRDLIDGNIDEFDQRLHNKFTAVETPLQTPGCSVELFVVSTGASELAAPGKGKLSKLAQNFNTPDDPDDVISIKVLGLSEVYEFLAQSHHGRKVDISVTLMNWSYLSDPHKAYFGMIDGHQLKEWWDSHGKKIVDRNIRYSLGSTEVNEQIKSTAINSPQNFWYFNNGVTLVADSVLKAANSQARHTPGNFSFSGASIVNGAQTVSTLSKVDDAELLSQVRVPIRFILLENTPQGFGLEVTRTNNLQNRVEGRDFVAQDAEQRRIQLEMSMDGVDYQYLRGEAFVQSSSSCELIEVTTALACSKGSPSLAVQLKAGIGKFFSDLTRAPYKTLFNPSQSGAAAFNIVLVQRVIDKWLENEKKKMTKRSGYAWGTLVHGNRLISSCVFNRLDHAMFSSTVDRYRKNIDEDEINKMCENVYNQMLYVLSEKYPGRFLATVFKNSSICKDVFENVV